MTTSPDRWTAVERVYHATLARPAEARAAFLAEACAGDDELRREVESLLAQVSSGDAAFTRGAVAAAAGLVSDVGRSMLTPGVRLGRYEVVVQIGIGGMGEVYRARDTRLKRDVAIKVLPASLSSDPERLHRFEQEAQAVAALNHPNILAIHDVGTHDGAPFIVSELLEGATLRDRLAAGRLPLPAALDIAHQTVDGLAAAHGWGNRASRSQAGKPFRE